MASPFGGQFVFTVPPPRGLSFVGVTLGVNNGTDPVFPSASPFTFDIEAFTAPGLTNLPTLDSGFSQGLLDPNGIINSAGFLTGTSLTLLSGDYTVSDAGSNSSITLGS